MGTLLGLIGLVVAVPILAVTMVVIRHILQGEIYGDTVHAEPAVLRISGQFRVPKATTSGS
jgi:predicted PurR-regulated permease PerM